MSALLVPFARTALAVVLLLAAAGCTMDRIEHDTGEALEWLRFTHGAEVRTSGRWQLPRAAAIEVVELAPAPVPGWPLAAQEGVDSVFPGPAAPADRAFRLLVSWPAERPFAIHTTLVRSSDGAVIEAARLEVTPRWLAGRSEGSVRQAFRDYAERFRPGY